jgi:hypothetical protein
MYLNSGAWRSATQEPQGLTNRQWSCHSKRLCIARLQSTSSTKTPERVRVSTIDYCGTAFRPCRDSLAAYQFGILRSARMSRPLAPGQYKEQMLNESRLSVVLASSNRQILNKNICQGWSTSDKVSRLPIRGILGSQKSNKNT